MKKITVFVLALFAVVYGIPLQEVFDNASSGSGYDKYIELDPTEVYTGAFTVDGAEDDPDMAIKIEGNGAVIDMEGETLIYANVSKPLIIEDCVIMNGQIRLYGNEYHPLYGTLPQPKATIEYVTFYKSHDYAIRILTAGSGITINRNIIHSTQPQGSAHPNLPEGPAIAFSLFPMFYGSPAVTDNWSYKSTISHSGQVGAYWELCDTGWSTPQLWEEAGSAPYNNISNTNPQLVDPDNGDFRVVEGSLAEDYGCQSFTIVGIDDDNLPESIIISNYPNPFNPETTISLKNNIERNVKAEIYSVDGKKVGQVYEGTLTQGNHKFSFDGSNLTSGTYFFTLKSDDGLNVSRKMVLMK